MLIYARYLSHLHIFTANAKRREGKRNVLTMTNLDCPNLTEP